MSGTLESLLAEGGEALQQARWTDARDAFDAALGLEAVGEALLGLSDALWWLGEPNFDQQAFTPSVHVDTDGTVVVTYHDLRNNTPDPVTLDTDYFAVSCESASESCADPASWKEVRITPASFNIRNAPFAAATSSATTWASTTPATPSWPWSGRPSPPTTPTSTSAASHPDTPTRRAAPSRSSRPPSHGWRPRPDLRMSRLGDL